MSTRKPAVKWDCGQCEALSHACLVSSTHSLEWVHLAPWKCSKGGMKKRACPKSSELDGGRREVAVSAKNWLYWTKNFPWKRRKWNEKNQLGISESTSKSHETTVLVNNSKSSKRRAEVMVNNRLSEIKTWDGVLFGEHRTKLLTYSKVSIIQAGCLRRPWAVLMSWSSVFCSTAPLLKVNKRFMGTSMPSYMTSCFL